MLCLTASAAVSRWLNFVFAKRLQSILSWEGAPAEQEIPTLAAKKRALKPATCAYEWDGKASISACQGRIGHWAGEGSYAQQWSLQCLLHCVEARWVKFLGSNAKKLAKKPTTSTSHPELHFSNITPDSTWYQELCVFQKGWAISISCDKSKNTTV